MPQFKLSYFEVRGYGEPIRFVLAHKNADWENEFVNSERWSAGMKQTAPMGQMPLLTLSDGRQLCQSRAILRYVAREVGLTPANSFDIGLADMYVDGIYNDLYPKYAPCYVPLLSGKVEESKEKFAAFKKDILPPFLDMFERFLTKNPSGWLVGDKVTYADLAVGEFFDRLQGCFDAEVLKGHPKIAAHAKRVVELPGIKEYIAKRPKMSL